MKTPNTTPDLLSPVQAALLKLTPKQRAKLAAHPQVDVNIDTLRRLVTPGPEVKFGPSYKLVATLHQMLVVEGWTGA